MRLEQSASRAEIHLFDRQAFYRRAYQRLKPGWNESLIIYRDLIHAQVQAETRLLDIGCGHGDFLGPVYARTPHTYGIDPDAAALKRNTIIKQTVIGTAEQLPFEAHTFDLIVAAWVFEHLEQPEQACREMYRVLKPGGRLIFLTPNTWNYNVWLIRAIPHRFHDGLTRRLYRRQARDTYRVRYKINSLRKINHLLVPLGFKEERVILNGDPSYISFNRPLFTCACLLERLLDAKPFQRARVHIIGVYQKEPKPAPASPLR